MNEYKNHTKMQNTNLGLSGVQIPSGIVHHTENLTVEQVKEQQKETIIKDKKKKIVPVMVKHYDDQQNINPFINPFQNQMLHDNTVDKSTTAPKPQIQEQPAPRTVEENKEQQQPKLPTIS